MGHGVCGHGDHILPRLYCGACVAGNVLSQSKPPPPPMFRVQPADACEICTAVEWSVCPSTATRPRLAFMYLPLKMYRLMQCRALLLADPNGVPHGTDCPRSFSCMQCKCPTMMQAAAGCCAVWMGAGGQFWLDGSVCAQCTGLFGVPGAHLDVCGRH